MEIVIVGAGGHAKELAFLLERLPQYNLLGFVDDNLDLEGIEICGKPVLGTNRFLSEHPTELAVAIGVANPISRKKIYNFLTKNTKLSFPNLIDPTALIGFNIHLGIGNVLMPYTTFTSDISIGDFNMINIQTTIGHDTKMGNFNSFFPNVNISGNVKIKNLNQFGTGTKVIQGVLIGEENIFGAGSTVIRDIDNNGKHVGTPTRMIESW